MSEYHVTWRIDIEADSAEEAASKALDIQQNLQSTATIFEVTKTGERLSQTIDLGW